MARAGRDDPQVTSVASVALVEREHSRAGDHARERDRIAGAAQEATLGRRRGIDLAALRRVQRDGRAGRDAGTDRVRGRVADLRASGLALDRAQRIAARERIPPSDGLAVRATRARGEVEDADGCSTVTREAAGAS